MEARRRTTLEESLLSLLPRNGWRLEIQYALCQSGGRETYSQSTQTLVNTVPETTEKEFNAAVDAASQAYKTWSQTSILRRQQVMFQ